MKIFQKKPDANTILKPSFDGVPNHAYALTTKPSKSELEKLHKRLKNLAEQVEYFELLLWKVEKSKWYEWDDDLCDLPKYKIYCDDGSFNIKEDSIFFKHYQKYLNNKKDLMETVILAGYEQQIKDIVNDRNALKIMQNELEKSSLINESKINETGPGGQSPLSTWKSLQKSFDKDIFKVPFIYPPTASSAPGDTSLKGDFALIASLISTKDAIKKIKNKLKNAINNANPDLLDKSKNCPPAGGKQKTVEDYQNISKGGGQGESDVPGNNCSDIKLGTPNTFEDVAKMIPYWPKSSKFTFGGKTSKTKTKLHEDVPNYKISTFKYPSRSMNGQITHKESPPLWACFTTVLQNAWQETCQETNYYPFEIVVGLRGFDGDPKTVGTTAYKNGISLHSYGLAFDLDPFIAGYKNKPDDPVNSVYTGAWTPSFIATHGLALWKLGVYKHSPSLLKKNAFQGENEPRLAENWQDAPSHYRGRGESGNARQKYIKIMKSAKGSLIVPPDAKPTLWVIRFCEKSGMRWGNGFFLKKTLERW